MNRYLLFFVVALAAGCSLPSRSILVTDGEVETYRAQALKALDSPDDWPHDPLLLQFRNRQLDRSRKLLYDFEPELVTVWVPTLGSDGKSRFICFHIDRSSRALRKISAGDMNR